jgi:hypothetical protein
MNLEVLELKIKVNNLEKHICRLLELESKNNKIFNLIIDEVDMLKKKVGNV